MKRCALKRRTPLRRKRPIFARTKNPKSRPIAFAPKPRKPLRKVSKAKAKKLRDLYFPTRNKFLKENPHCAICVIREIIPPRRATEVHHIRGRAGSLLWDTRFFSSSCRACREWPHENATLARELGILAEAKDWNVVPREA